MCLNDEEIQKYCDGESKADSNIANHLIECAECKNKTEKYENSVKVLGGALSSSQKPSEEECEEAGWLFLYLQNKLPAKQKENMEKHIAECPYCRSTVIVASELSEIKEVVTQAERKRIFWNVFKPVTALAFSFLVAVFGYNVFTAGSSLSELKLLHKELSAGQAFEEPGGADALLALRLDSEMASVSLDVKSIVNLESAEGILTAGSKNKNISDAAFFVKEELRNKKEKTNSLLLGIYNIVSGAEDSNKDVKASDVLAGTEEYPEGDGLTAALKLEKDGKTAEAIEKYSEYMNKQGKSFKEKTVRISVLRLGICYQKNTDTAQAENSYTELRTNAKGTFEAYVAGKMLSNFKTTDGVNSKTEEVLTASVPVEEIFIAAGANMRLMNYGKAIEVYKKVVAAEGVPASLADWARLNIGWCNKQAGKFEEARKEFAEVAGLKSLGAYLSASTYLGQGMERKAVEEYENIEKAGGDNSAMAANGKMEISDQENNYISGASQFQSGYLYLSSLNEPEKAKKTFNRLRGFETAELGNYAKQNLNTRIKKEKVEGEEEKETGIIQETEKEESPAVNVVVSSKRTSKPVTKKKWKSQDEIDKNEYEDKADKPKDKENKNAAPPAQGGSVTVKPQAAPQKKVEGGATVGSH